jgi:hypothetical protein
MIRNLKDKKFRNYQNNNIISFESQLYYYSDKLFSSYFKDALPPASSICFFASSAASFATAS